MCSSSAGYTIYFKGPDLGEDATAFFSRKPLLKQIAFDRDEMSKYSLNEISQAVVVFLKVGWKIIPSLV